MSISFMESFTGYDWERYATVAGDPTPTVILGLSMLTWWLGYSGRIALLGFAIAGTLAIWQGPYVYGCISQMTEVRELCEEKMRSYSTRGGLYVVLSLILFIGNTPLVAGGLLLMAVGVLYIFAHINQVSDAQDSTAAGSSRAGEYSYVPPGVAVHPGAFNRGDDATYQASFGSGVF